MGLFKFGLCEKIICCLFDQFFIRDIDGKYRSATVPLVFILLYLFSDAYPKQQQATIWDINWFY